VTDRDAPCLLILETSGRVASVALAEGGRLLGTRRLDEARRHARDLAPAVAGLLAGQGRRPRDVHAVLVGRGPGSYTGLRVGVMSAKASRRGVARPAGAERLGHGPGAEEVGGPTAAGGASR
jgi:tRNA threonylcarbamoyl adenosine modification protein YeaZ